tara:strand:- start:419 stop:1471 length:1053 start_codon:yes stop_codon:yes gene_type:complete
MRVLFGVSSSKFFHVQELVNALEKLQIQCKLVFDQDYADNYPSRKIENWFSSNQKFKKLIDEFKPDAIFIDRQRHFGLQASKTKIPLLMQLRGDYWKETEMARKTLYKSFPKNLALKKWEEIAQVCFEGSKVILPLCNYLKEIVKSRYPDKPNEVLQSGITASNWFPTKGMKLKHPCVGLVQSAVILEKTEELLTLTKVLEKMPEVNFYWVGDGPYRDTVLPILEKFENFHWLGKLEYPDKVRDFLTEVDVYALVTGIDMSPLTVQEAQLMEKPVVATNVGGVPELMLDGKTGFLVKKGSDEELYEKLSLLINDEKKSQRMGKEGRKYVSKNFSWEKIATDLVQITSKHL